MYNLFVETGRFFAELLNVSLTASLIALVVILIRFFMKKTPKWVTCILWGMVGLKLILPFSTSIFISSGIVPLYSKSFFG